jgi:transcription antitermination factor NusG
MNSWFALHVKSRCEKAVSLILNSKGVEEFLPVYRSTRIWVDRTREIDLPLFPGYVFCRFDPDERMPVVTTPGVVGIVRYGRVFAPVDPAEIAALQALAKSRLPTRRWPYVETGEPVIIEGGALDGVRGILLQLKSAKKVVLSVTLLRRSVLVEIDGERIKLVPPEPPIRAFSQATGLT